MDDKMEPLVGLYAEESVGFGVLNPRKMSEEDWIEECKNYINDEGFTESELDILWNTLNFLLCASPSFKGVRLMEVIHERSHKLRVSRYKVMQKQYRKAMKSAEGL
jgi:hypothetical protein